jgi:DHA2 family multidrug resistance protein
MFGSTFLLPLYLQNALGYTAFQAGSLFLPVGIIMAIMAPIAGQLSDKVNPKIPALIGIFLLSGSLFVNQYLSLYSETSSIMVSLYMRGFGMALIFTPLSALALSDIPRDRMAQASGLFNVLRQIGGSFGVALMGTLLTQRTAYHTTIYGESLNQASPVAQQAMRALKMFSQQAVGGAATVSSMRAQGLVVYHLAQQAFVSAVDDDFLVASAITVLCAIPIVFLRYKKKGKAPGPKVVAME